MRQSIGKIPGATKNYISIKIKRCSFYFSNCWLAIDDEGALNALWVVILHDFSHLRDHLHARTPQHARAHVLKIDDACHSLNATTKLQQ